MDIIISVFISIKIAIDLYTHTHRIYSSKNQRLPLAISYKDEPSEIEQSKIMA